MNADIVIGLFALYVAMVSLYLVLSGHQEALLALLRHIWGRTVGHTLYFLSRVALPMLICVVCLGWGVRHYDAAVVTQLPEPQLHLNVNDYRELINSWHQDPAGDGYEEVYGA